MVIMLGGACGYPSINMRFSKAASLILFFWSDQEVITQLWSNIPLIYSHQHQQHHRLCQLYSDVKN